MAKLIQGVVASNKGDKTIIVSVTTKHTHPIYKKQYTRSRRFAAHDESNQANVGDKVTIREVRPISATKRFKLEKIVERARLEHVEPTETEAA